MFRKSYGLFYIVLLVNRSAHYVIILGLPLQLVANVILPSIYWYNWNSGLNTTAIVQSIIINEQLIIYFYTIGHWVYWFKYMISLDKFYLYLSLYIYITVTDRTLTTAGLQASLYKLPNTCIVFFWCTPPRDNSDRRHTLCLSARNQWLLGPSSPWCCSLSRVRKP